jgi:hypothetical protein
MVTGQLPFDHPSDLQNILRQIVRDEPQYPDILTSGLIDLLRRILTKAPDERIDIEHIKTHPWFSQSEYVRIFEIHVSSDEWVMRGVDRTIIDEMERMGIDGRSAAETLLLGEYTQETAVYSMLHRRAVMERIRESMEALRGNTGTLLVSSTTRTSMSGAADRAALIAPGSPQAFKRGTTFAIRRTSVAGAPAILKPKLLNALVKGPKSITMH